jgi:hypothetical protein
MVVALESPLRTSKIAWLQQHADFFTQLTVRETLKLAAFLEQSEDNDQTKSCQGENGCSCQAENVRSCHAKRLLLVQRFADFLNIGYTLDPTIGSYNDDNVKVKQKENHNNNNIMLSVLQLDKPMGTM